MYVKLKALQRQLALEKLRVVRYDAEKVMSRKESRRRLSLFGERHEDAVIKNQIAYFSRPRQLFFFAINFMFGMFLVCLMFAQISQSKTGDDECMAKDSKIWTQCRDKVMFCGQPFKPRCNCLSIEVGWDNSHNFTRLPYGSNGIMNEMTGLSYISMHNGPLQELPKNFCEIHPELTSVFLNNNSLKSINLYECKYLVFVWLDINGLEHFPDISQSVDTIRSVSVRKNKIRALPQWLKNADAFAGLLLSGNNLTEISDSIFSELAQLRRLDISSNTMIQSVSHSIYKSNTIEELRLINLPLLKQLPDIPDGKTYKLRRLFILDIRNTSITSLPDHFFKLRALEFVYLDGSPLCSNGFIDTVPKDSSFGIAIRKPGMGCTKQCSILCNSFDRSLSYCVRSLCSNTECKYQDGKCLVKS
jgi:hypothetical protein